MSDLERALIEFNSNVARARNDYAQHPTEFDKQRYCSTCALPAGTGHRCPTCSKTRAGQVARAKRKANE